MCLLQRVYEHRSINKRILALEKGLTDEFYGFKKAKKTFYFVIDSYLKDSAFTAVKRDAEV